MKNFIDTACAVVISIAFLCVMAFGIFGHQQPPVQLTPKVQPKIERACTAPTEITVTAPNGAKVTVLIAQITQVSELLPDQNFEDPRAHSIINESSGMQQAVRETREQVDIEMHTPQCEG